MDRLHPIEYRNAELETELRLLRQQLEAAHEANRYLVTHVLSLGSPSSVSRRNDILVQARLDETLKQNRRLQARLARSECDRLYAEGRADPVGNGGHRAPNSPSTHSEGYLAQEVLAVSDDDDLIQFGEDVFSTTKDNTLSPNWSSTPITKLHGGETPLIPFKPFQPAQKSPDKIFQRAGDQPTSLRSEIIKENPKTNFMPETYDENACDTATNAASVIRFSDGSTMDIVSDTFDNSDRLPTPITKRRPSNRFGFSDEDYRRLINLASLIEVDGHGDSTDYWESYAEIRAWHSPDEWQAYYREVIRPQFWAKKAVREGYNGLQQPDFDPAKADLDIDSQSTPSRNKAIPKHLPDLSRVSITCKAPHYFSRLGNPLAVASTVSAEQAAGAKEESLTSQRALNSVSLPQSKSFDSLQAQADTPVLLPATHAFGSNSTWQPKHPENSVSKSATAAPDAGILASKEAGALSSSMLSGLASESGPAATVTTPGSDRLIAPVPASLNLQPELAATLPPYKYAGHRIADRPGFAYTPATRLVYFPQVGDEQLYRTVLITRLPPTITLEQVIDKVRGGRLVSMTYIDMTRMKFGSKSSPELGTNGVQVQFFRQSSATRFVGWCKEHGLCFPAKPTETKSVRAKVDLIMTPTRPLNRHLQTAVVETNLTRCIDINYLPETLTVEALLRVMYDFRRGFYDHEGLVDAKPPLRIFGSQDGALRLEFHSLNDAKMAGDVFTHSFRVGQGRVEWHFVADPCALPLGNPTTPNVQEDDRGDKSASMTDDFGFANSVANGGERAADEEPSNTSPYDAMPIPLPTKSHPPATPGGREAEQDPEEWNEKTKPDVVTLGQREMEVVLEPKGVKNERGELLNPDEVVLDSDLNY